MIPNIDITPDIKLSVKQTFGIESDMEIEGFSKKMNLYQKLIEAINSIETLPWLCYLVFHLIKEF